MKAILLTATILTGNPIVLDADTIMLQHERIRLQGIDAPELDQTCHTRSGALWQCGIEARAALVRYVGSRAVSCVTNGKDVFGRWLGTCSMDDQDIGAWLVREGYALAFIRYSNAYVADEAAARSAQKGLWAGSFTLPWEWRKSKR